MASSIRIIRSADHTTGKTVYDIRRVEGAALIHLGTARRNGLGSWSAHTPRGGAWTDAPTRREAVAYLTEADAVASA